MLDFPQPMRRFGRVLVTNRALALMVGALVFSSVALAAGGSTIKTAPTVQFGVDMVGNTAAIAQIVSDSCDINRTEWWRIPLITGDHLTVKYEDSGLSGGKAVGVEGAVLYPAGTDDFNLAQAAALVSPGMNPNLHAELDYDATATGIYPLAFVEKDRLNCLATGVPGAYDFTATVQHKAYLLVAHTPVPRTGTIVVRALFPDGTAIRGGLGATLYGNWARKWHKLGRASASNGLIRIHFSLPAKVASHVIQLRVTAGGASFQGNTLTWRTTVR